MRWAISADCTGEPPGELIASATALAPRVLEGRASSGATDLDRQAARAEQAARGDDAGEADHRHDGPAAKAISEPIATWPALSRRAA